LDTLNLQLGTEKVFYFVEAADKRNNRSPVSDTIQLQLPDLFPPNSPVIQKLIQKQDSVVIVFQGSDSKDLAFQNIYRKNIDTETSWTKIIMMDKLYKDTMYLDLSTSGIGNFAYTMTAIDTTGLESVPVTSSEIYLKKKVEKFKPFVNIEKTVDESKKTITLTWQCQDQKDLESVLVYKGIEKTKMGKYQYVDAPLMTITDSYTIEPSMYYVLKPVYKSHKGDLRSDYIEVILPGVEK